MKNSIVVLLFIFETSVNKVEFAPPPIFYLNFSPVYKHQLFSSMRYTWFDKPSYRGWRKKGGKDQESMQSSTIPAQDTKWESDKNTIKHHKQEQRGQPFPNRAAINRRESMEAQDINNTNDPQKK